MPEVLEGPVAPLFVADDLPAAGGVLGDAPEDFHVSEKALYEPSGEGEHLYVRMEKTNLTTPELVSALARAARVRERDVGYAGLKDKHATTEQWLSLPRSALPPAVWELPDGVRVLAESRHQNKLRTGPLAGNLFVIRLGDVPQGGLERARAILERVTERGLYNYFGEQRFGHEGGNVARALEWLAGSTRPDRRKGRFYDKLYPSVIQAEVFNRYLGLRRALGLHRLLAGEVVRLDGTGSYFVVEEPEVEQHRLDARDLVLTGPLLGPKAKAASGAALELEQAALDSLGVGAEARTRLARHAPGTRRDLLVPILEASLSAPAENTLEFRFFLPAGAYATQFIREFTRAPWFERRARSFRSGA
jgi:tRNA pseudouridine13 synthase